MLLTDRVILITGASRGLGAEMARVYGAHGARVYVNYLQSEAKARAVAADIEAGPGSAVAIQADVTVYEEVEAMVQRIVEQSGRLDVIVNNALPHYQFDAAAPYTKLETLTWAHFDQQLSGTVKGAFHTVKAALPAMKAQGYGKVVNISTNLIYNPVVTYYDYTTAKAGLLGLTRNLAAELGPFGIRVNLLAGGLLQTTDASRVTGEAIFEAIAGSTPLRKTTTPQDFAEASVFFASALSDAITGQSIAIDGGLTMA
jgi:3-oxoacyl-[acyl-carrier protein] reductase